MNSTSYRLIAARSHRLAVRQSASEGIAAAHSDTAPIVLLHGFSGSVDFWPSVWPAYLDGTRRWACISLPGHAPSEVPSQFGPQDVNADTLVAVIGDVINELYPETGVHLVGWSTGGFAALALAATRPARVLSVASLCGFARGQWGDLLGLMQRLARSGPVGRGLLRAGLRRVAAQRWLYGRVMKRFAARTLSWTEPNRGWLESHHAAFAAHDPQTLTALLGGLRPIDITDWLQRIEAPTLVIGGTHDPVIPLQETHHIASHVRGSELLELPDCGHLFFAEAGSLVFERLEGWLEARGVPSG